MVKHETVYTPFTALFILLRFISLFIWKNIRTSDLDIFISVSHWKQGMMHDAVLVGAWWRPQWESVSHFLSCDIFIENYLCSHDTWEMFPSGGEFLITDEKNIYYWPSNVDILALGFMPSLYTWNKDGRSFVLVGFLSCLSPFEHLRMVMFCLVLLPICCSVEIKC